MKQQDGRNLFMHDHHVKIESGGNSIHTTGTAGGASSGSNPRCEFVQTYRLLLASIVRTEFEGKNEYLSNHLPFAKY